MGASVAFGEVPVEIVIGDAEWIDVGIGPEGRRVSVDPTLRADVRGFSTARR